MGQKVALITGITGQDGSYLAELLLERGYRVYGIIRRASTPNTPRIDHIYANPNLTLVYGDLTDAGSVYDCVNNLRPDEVYNLGAQSHVKTSFELPAYTFESIVSGTLHLLEAIKHSARRGSIRMYQASSSEMFGNHEGLLNENSPMHPCSPYGIAKLAAHELCNAYRSAYGMYVSCGILFNHESPRRGVTFVTRKITRAVARIKLGLQEKVELGNLDAWRDWGWAPEYVAAMPTMLAQEYAKNYVLATGKAYRVKDFAQVAFSHVGLSWHDHVGFNEQRYMRPVEIDVLKGDSMMARVELGWRAETRFQDIVQYMVDADMKAEGGKL